MAQQVREVAAAAGRLEKVWLGGGGGGEGNTIRSLADEILDELYGTRDVGEEEEEEEERQESPEYCNIEDLRSEEGRAESEAEESLRAGEYNTDLTAG